MSSGVSIWCTFSCQYYTNPADCSNACGAHVKATRSGNSPEPGSPEPGSPLYPDGPLTPSGPVGPVPPTRPLPPYLVPRIRDLEARIRQSGGAIDPHDLLALGDAYRDAGRQEDALRAYQLIPRFVQATDVQRAWLLTGALQGQGRSLTALGRIPEAETAFALAQHIASISPMDRVGHLPQGLRIEGSQ